MFSVFGNMIGKSSAKRIAHATALGVSILLGCGASAPSAQAAYIVTLVQQGPNVVATGSGSIDLTDLVNFAGTLESSGITPNAGIISTGAGDNLAYYHTATGPTNFGSGGNTFADSGSGELVGINTNSGASGNSVGVPVNYISGSLVSDTATYDNATFASLGVTPGTYVWAWGSGANADSFTLQIGVTAPEPASLALLAVGLGGLGIVLRRSRAALNAAIA